MRRHNDGRCVNPSDLIASRELSELRPSAQRDPDARGYYGAYGGRFVPETLVAPVAELEARLPRGAQPTRRSATSSTRSAARLRRPADAALRGAAAVDVARRRADLPQARGSRAHRRAQDQQRARPGAARQAHGQAARHRRDRRRPARRRDRDGLRAARPRVRRLHGRRRHGAAGAQRLPHASCSARRCASVDGGSRTLKDAINEAMRDWVAQRRRQLLPARLGARPASVSADGARVPVGHRPGGAARSASTRLGRLPDAIVACVGGGSNAMGIFDAFIDDAGVRLIGVEAGGHGITPGEHAARFAGGSAGVLQGTRSYVLQDDERQHRADALDLGRPRLRRGRSRARVAARLGARRVRLDRRRRRARRRFSGWRARRGSSRRSSRRTRSRTRCRLAPWHRRRTRSLLVNLSGRGDKDVMSVAEGARADQAAERRRAALMSRLDADVRTAARAQARRPGDLRHGRRSRRRAVGARSSSRVARAGADVLEVGVPFSDPLADGPVIQRATERALAGGMTLRGDARRRARACAPTVDTPIVLFTYANPVVRMDPTVFARAAADAGVDGVLMLDYPVEEAEPLRAPLVDAGLDPIFLISPTTTDERIRRSAELGRGFLYVISRLGVTGVRDRLRRRRRALVGARARRVDAAGGARLRHLAARARRRGVPRRRRGGRRQRARERDRGARRGAGRRRARERVCAMAEEQRCETASTSCADGSTSSTSSSCGCSTRAPRARSRSAA